MTIRICVPYYYKISDETQESLHRLSLPHTKITCEGTYIGVARNSMVVGSSNSYAHPTLDEGWTHVLQLDSDIGFEQEHIERLIAYDLPIVSGAYEARSNKNQIVAGMWNTVPGNMGIGLPGDTTGLMEVDYVGAGFLLIKREVFEACQYPWFAHEWVYYTDNEGHKHAMQTGEDGGFCLRAKRNGYKIYCDCDCRVIHNTNKEAVMSEREKLSVNDLVQNIYDGISVLKRELVAEKALSAELRRRLGETEKTNTEGNPTPQPE